MILSAYENDINSTDANHDISMLEIADKVYFYIFRVYTLISVCVMITSSISIVRYLHRHMRSMVQSGSGFSTPKIQSQMRVAVTGLSQGVLYFLLDTYNLVESFTNIYSHHVFTAWVSFTVLSLYITGTTVNLGVGQAAFSLNDTVSTNSVCIQVPHSVLKIYEVTHHTVQVNFLLHVCVMMLSNASTVIYLGKHTRRMLANRQSLSCPNFRGEVRVTVIGILQGLLFFLCCVSTCS
ncbi:taste receptor, type 2, member 201, tandem duplicate 1 [Halichoeres trimaculatus]|uniref:taste receptor, type 2, member 201, tandem duplicate 1 n=1 Tax=Halichoeres trimaculatus TaxID=147232 RepID=UPI003D9DDC15